MTKSEAYNGIYDSDPCAAEYRVFFAFCEESLEKGMTECGYLNASELTCVKALGLYGSKKNIDSFLAVYQGRGERVANECDPQKVYDYEYSNHECDISYNGDEDAIRIVVDYFGKDRAKLVKRKRGGIVIGDID